MYGEQLTKIPGILKGQIFKKDSKWEKNNLEVCPSGRKQQLHRKEAELGLVVNGEISLP